MKNAFGPADYQEIVDMVISVIMESVMKEIAILMMTVSMGSFAVAESVSMWKDVQSVREITIASRVSC